MKTILAGSKIDSRLLRVGLGGALAFALGALTLSPTWDLTSNFESGSYTAPTSCIKRQVSATYSSANVWQSKTVCEENEVAIAGMGRCPSAGYLRGVDIVSGGGEELDRTVYIQCSASGGGALWTATCCEMMNLEEAD
jgi:hypothetical protein